MVGGPLYWSQGPWDHVSRGGAHFSPTLSPWALSGQMLSDSGFQRRKGRNITHEDSPGRRESKRAILSTRLWDSPATYPPSFPSLYKGEVQGHRSLRSHKLRVTSLCPSPPRTVSPCIYGVGRGRGRGRAMHRSGGYSLSSVAFTGCTHLKPQCQ